MDYFLDHTLSSAACNSLDLTADVWSWSPDFNGPRKRAKFVALTTGNDDYVYFFGGRTTGGLGHMGSNCWKVRKTRQGKVSLSW